MHPSRPQSRGIHIMTNLHLLARASGAAIICTTIAALMPIQPVQSEISIGGTIANWLSGKDPSVRLVCNGSSCTYIGPQTRSGSYSVQPPPAPDTTQQVRVEPPAPPVPQYSRPCVPEPPSPNPDSPPLPPPPDTPISYHPEWMNRRVH